MEPNIRFEEILNQLRAGILSLSEDDIIMINQSAALMLNKKEHTAVEIIDMDRIIHISNILFNNTDRDLLPLEDGVYDLLLEQYKVYNPAFQVGAEPIHFAVMNEGLEEQNKMTSPITKIDTNYINEEMLFGKDLSYQPMLNKNDMMFRPITRLDNRDISKRLVTSDNKHKYPKLVGTLDKCKFVLNSQALEKGVFDDNNVKILERDFFGKHIQEGILNPNRTFTVIAELKYDGLSVEGEILGKFLDNARSRGDANESLAADLTPILKGYCFNHAPNLLEPIGIKFEAIITYPNLMIYNQMKNKTYKNCRTAISGIFSSSDAYRYRDLITLVPLASSIEEFDRLEDITFINKYYRTGEALRYAVITGTYTEVLFQIKRFVEEAEYMRDCIPFMYDGVVISYQDKDLVNALGRVNAVNKYSMAIKFNPLKKLTTFRGYSFTVGQDGSVTPMIHYDPVEFYGTIHDLSSGHSYKRFRNLELRIGDVIEVEYTNDVMAYVTKPDNSHNASNTNPIAEFPKVCPSCGNELKLSDSGKSMMCNNLDCPERNLRRIVNMMDKLNLKDFAEASVKKIAKYNLRGLFSITKADIVEDIGEVNSQKFIDQMKSLQTEPIYDYKIVGALGFTGIAEEKWKLILNHYSLTDILSMDEDHLKIAIVQIKGIGPVTADVISRELFSFFRDDLNTIIGMNNIIQTKGVKSTGKIIRFTGFRDQSLVDLLNSMGHDASSTAGLTKKTDILLVPIEGHTSSKTSKVGENTQIVSVQEFKENMDKYL